MNGGRRIPHLCNFTFRLCLTLISLSCPSTALSIIVPLHACLPKLHPTSPCATVSRPPLPYIVSSWIHLGILYIHIISYISLFLIGCWREGQPVLTQSFLLQVHPTASISPDLSLVLVLGEWVGGDVEMDVHYILGIGCNTGPPWVWRISEQNIL